MHSHQTYLLYCCTMANIERDADRKDDPGYGPSRGLVLSRTVSCIRLQSSRSHVSDGVGSHLPRAHVSALDVEHGRTATL